MVVVSDYGGERGGVMASDYEGQRGLGSWLGIMGERGLGLLESGLRECDTRRAICAEERERDD